MIKKILKIFIKPSNRCFDEKKDITRMEFNKYNKDGTIIIDVRSKQEYEEGHIDGAINISEYDIKKKAKELLKDKNEKIILYCSTGYRSKRAQKQLERIGYTNVYNVFGGIEL